MLLAQGTPLVRVPSPRTVRPRSEYAGSGSKSCRCRMRVLVDGHWVSTCSGNNLAVAKRSVTFVGFDRETIMSMLCGPLGYNPADEKDRNVAGGLATRLAENAVGTASCCRFSILHFPPSMLHFTKKQVRFVSAAESSSAKPVDLWPSVPAALVYARTQAIIRGMSPTEALLVQLPSPGGAQLPLEERSPQRVGQGAAGVHSSSSPPRASGEMGRPANTVSVQTAEATERRNLVVVQPRAEGDSAGEEAGWPGTNRLWAEADRASATSGQPLAERAIAMRRAGDTGDGSPCARAGAGMAAAAVERTVQQLLAPRAALAASPAGGGRQGLRADHPMCAAPALDALATSAPETLICRTGSGEVRAPPIGRGTTRLAQAPMASGGARGGAGQGAVSGGGDRSTQLGADACLTPVPSESTASFGAAGAAPHDVRAPFACVAATAPGPLGERPRKRRGGELYAAGALHGTQRMLATATAAASELSPLSLPVIPASAPARTLALSAVASAPFASTGEPAADCRGADAEAAPPAASHAWAECREDFRSFICPSH